jgi:MFS transporter, DHA2 family, methylenomycin A resistance protein
MTAAVVEEAPHERVGIAAAVLNASRQVGGVLGVALLSAFVRRHNSFVPRMHVALLIAGGTFVVGCALTLLAAQCG